MSSGTDSELLRRRRLLVEVGNATASAMSIDAKRRYDIDGAIAFNGESRLLDKAVDTYFDRVRIFKAEHVFANGDRINFSKVAGLMALVILEIGASKFFRLNERLVGTVYEPMIGGVFVYRLVAAILMLDLDMVDEDVERDLLRCLTLHPNIRADAEWLFWSMRVLQVAYGDPSLGRA